MKLFAAWLRTYRLAIALCLLLLVDFPLLHFLGGGSITEIRYALLLGAALCLIFAAFSLRRFALRMRALRLALEHLPEEESQLPHGDTPLQEAYRALCAAYLRHTQDTKARALHDRRDAEEYFTLWLHQMKTPLAAMDLMAQSVQPIDRSLLRQELLKTQQYADMALTYQRLTSMANDMELSRVPLYPLCCASASQLMPLFRYGRISLTLEPFDGEALTDAKWLSFVIAQVLTNALKYTSPGGSITVECPQNAVLTIRDTGIGIRPEDVPRVFDRGFTGLSGRSHESTGIGLYLCRQIMTGLGHAITLESIVGSGTCVTLDLRRNTQPDV